MSASACGKSWAEPSRGAGEGNLRAGRSGAASWVGEGWGGVFLPPPWWGRAAVLSGPVSALGGWYSKVRLFPGFRHAGPVSESPEKIGQRQRGHVPRRLQVAVHRNGAYRARRPP